MWNNLPPVWLLHFATYMPIKSVNALMISKRFRKHLLHNTAWKVRCTRIPAYAMLVQSEIEGLQPENFWYSWYISHCNRYMPIQKSRYVKMRLTKRENDTMTISVPRQGSLIVKGGVCHVVVRAQSGCNKLNPDVPTIFSVAKTFEKLEDVLSKGYSTFIKCDEYKITLRDNGNMSIPCYVLSSEEY